MDPETQRGRAQGIRLGGRSESRKALARIIKRIPEELLPEVTILIQDSGFVSIKPKRLARMDWYRINRRVRNMGGRWVSNSSFSHWSLPLKNLFLNS